MRLSCILQIIARSIMIYNEAERRVIYCNTECYNFNIQRKPNWIIDLSHTPKKMFLWVNELTFHKNILHKIILMKDF